MRQTGIFAGRAQVVYPYGRYGWTRGGGKVWHGGLDLVGLDDTTVRMPYYKGKRITGRVVRARIVTDRRDKTWEAEQNRSDFVQLDSQKLKTTF